MSKKFQVLTAMMSVAAVIALMIVLVPGKSAALAFDYNTMPKIQKRLLSTFLENQIAPPPGAVSGRPDQYFPSDDECGGNKGDNVKVNQNCQNLSDAAFAGRGQANNETSIAADPYHPNHMVASYNDYRRGDGNCYSAYSSDQGKTWNDSTIPQSFIQGTLFGVAREYVTTGGDTSVAWDTKGNAYLSCQVFNRGAGVSQDPDQSSALLMFRSTKNGGASWNFPGRIVVGQKDKTGAVLLDKQLMTVDNHKGSPFQDRVYVSWTLFAADGTAYIYLAYSKDYGETFSAPVLVSKDSPLCPNTYGLPTPQGRCNENQFSQPFTGPDGALYVTWANFNNGLGSKPLEDNESENGETGGVGFAPPSNATPIDNRNQMLLAKSTDGGVTFSAPVKVADYFDLPDCESYQAGKDAGRACVPEKGATTNSFFRATNYPVGAVNPKKPNQVVVSFGSYINRNSKESNGCVPVGFSPDTGLNLYVGVKTPGACNNDILVSVSTNGGTSFTGTTTDPRQLSSATPARRQRTSSQFWQWMDFSKEGLLAVSYYDRQYGTDEVTGYMDVSVSGSENMKDFATTRATSSSMPPPTQFSGAFFGDYSGMTIADGVVYPLWMDTRNAELFLCPGTGVVGVPPAVCTASASNAPLANDQDAYTTPVYIPTP